ncbi:phenylalanine--tRNA ligase subunit beta [Rosistilla oblonga]|uniref:Phenylalanine--tRNA ligase beta subunit n=1 Tax=Rosistilla oblonga TaxID=2527990 RepID=A0A518IRD3_9BACT|nr:phenylalanine--tRNA ligase subunit beta [Rosistilla oblonga]QDV55648.1 Phenylalanine--tRNA ligase beta subunit [Rosistilla oblonga]
MLVSWNWLRRYVDLPMTEPELSERLSMTGLNHEGTEVVDGETVIDLEVTSNRGDCLGHIGVAREISVLYELPLCKPQPEPAEGSGKASDSIRVTNVFSDACPRYTARVIRGVKVGPSPGWLVDALRAVGIGSVNNVVDITNFVLMECGQPLHAFDLAKLAGDEIVVRPARPEEEIEAIDHKTYTLDPEMCVIADRDRAVAVAGVMGGASTEVTESTTDLLIESAVFTPLSVRRTARKLKLHSPSSFRFERRVDPQGVDWASRRCCELILEIAGGTLEQGVVDTEPQLPAPTNVCLRLAQVERVLGVKVPDDEIRKILTALGCEEQTADVDKIHTCPPSWRHDLTREIDLIEEIARIYGYEKIPDDSPIPVAASQKRPFDEAVSKIRDVLVGSGISEAMTPSVVPADVDELVSPWTDRQPLTTETALLKGAKTLRRSILPSLLDSRHANQAASGADAELFEVAHIYVPPAEVDGLPEEQYCVAGVSGQDFYQVKGIVETLLRRLGIAAVPDVRQVEVHGLDKAWSIELTIAGELIGYVGQLCPDVQKSLKLEKATTCFELNLDAMLAAAHLVPQFRSVSPFPSVSRDLNLVVDEAIRWVDLAASVRAAVGPVLADLKYVETYRDPAKDGEGKKRILMSIDLQSPDSTLTNAQADAMRGDVVDRCNADHGAVLLG